MLELLWPWSLLLLPLPLPVWWLWSTAGSADAALRAPFFAAWSELQAHADAGLGAARKWLIGLLLALIWLGAVLGLARPTWIGEPVSLPASARDLLLAVDISGSMRVEDMADGGQMVSRLQAVKQVVGDFIERRHGDRIGLILFGSNAYLQAPLTFDGATVRRFLQEAQLGFAGRETAIGDAIGLAVKRLHERPADSRVVILLTDGANTAGVVQPLAAAALAADNHIRIHTVGIGAEQMTVPGFFGRRRLNPSADLDEKTLTAIASQTDGHYFRARNPDELVEIYQLLDQLEPVEQDAETFRPQKSLLHWPLAVAYGCSLVLALYRCLRPQ